MAFVDPYSGYVFCSGQNGSVSGQELYGSTPANNGSNMFAFNGLAPYSIASGMVFDNRGNMYIIAQSGLFANTGLYTTPSPWTSSSVFTKIMLNPALSYYFNTVFIDPCGYMYGTARGAGISRSTLPLNTPAASILQTPVNGAISTTLTPAITWAHLCTPDSFRLQIATDSTFSSPLYNQLTAAAYTYTPVAGMLATGTTYYWRLQATNKAGAGVWSPANHFTTAGTGSTLAINLLGFTATAQSANQVLLNWQTAATNPSIIYIPQRSSNGISFTPLCSAIPATATNSYQYTDSRPLPNSSYYRICCIDGRDTFYTNAAQIFIAANTTLTISPQPVHNIAILTISNHALLGTNATITDVQGHIIKSIPVSNLSLQIDVQDLPTGLYIIRMADGSICKMAKE